MDNLSQSQGGNKQTVAEWVDGIATRGELLTDREKKQAVADVERLQTPCSAATQTRTVNKLLYLEGVQRARQRVVRIARTVDYYARSHLVHSTDELLTFASTVLGLYEEGRYGAIPPKPPIEIATEFEATIRPLEGVYGHYETTDKQNQTQISEACVDDSTSSYGAFMADHVPKPKPKPKLNLNRPRPVKSPTPQPPLEEDPYDSDLEPISKRVRHV
jgi:hypothetical protein